MSVKTVYTMLPIDIAIDTMVSHLNSILILEGKEKDTYQICNITKFGISDSDNPTIIATCKSSFITGENLQDLMNGIHTITHLKVFTAFGENMDHIANIDKSYLDKLKNTDDPEVIKNANEILLLILNTADNAVISATSDYNYDDFANGSIIDKIFDAKKEEEN